MFRWIVDTLAAAYCADSAVGFVKPHTKAVRRRHSQAGIRAVAVLPRAGQHREHELDEGYGELPAVGAARQRPGRHAVLWIRGQGDEPAVRLRHLPSSQAASCLWRASGKRRSARRHSPRVTIHRDRWPQLAPALWLGGCAANGSQPTQQGWTQASLRSFLAFLDAQRINRIGIWCMDPPNKHGIMEGGAMPVRPCCRQWLGLR